MRFTQLLGFCAGALLVLACSGTTVTQNVVESSGGSASIQAAHPVQVAQPQSVAPRLRAAYPVPAATSRLAERKAPPGRQMAGRRVRAAL